ncbi:unnamed protein product [Somion occarium]|uniref:Clathrin/coatomer adaptor adaptin-like N-terminal domain-containing protein n=1 Tax=Somion occarium TaxID=3059160 RepID=A0ABP1E7E2_9APHY
MSGLNLESFAENASRLGTRLQETISEHTRDLSIARASSAGYLDTPEEKVRLIRKQLDSNSDREKLDAMKRLIALISKGRNVSEYFAQVVKNVASHNLEIRKLVYIYLLRYAEQEPDLALLSINTFQKDLSDPNPLIRAMALRVLSGIRVPMIGSIVVLAIKKCAADISPYVKKAAAQAIPKCYSLDSSHQPELITIISTLLRDRSPLPIGSVAVAFEAVCPTRLDLFHQHYRRLCRTLIDMDDWGQVDLLNLLVRYARTMLPRPVITEDADGQSEEVDPDLKLLLSSAEPLFQSNNPAVVLAVARAFYYLGPPSEMKKIVSPLLRLLHISPEIERVTLSYILVVARSSPSLFTPHYTSFLVRTDDIRQVKKDKMQLLRLLISAENHQALLREFIYYADDSDDDLVADAIQAIGYCARLVPESTQQCLTALMSFIQSKHDPVVANAVLVLKSLVQLSLHHHQTLTIASTSGAYSPMAIISRLAYRIEEIRHPKARACVLWLVAGFFTKETPYVKLQTVTLAAKLLVLCPSDRTLGLLNRYVLSLARYDLNFDVRDRARMLGSLLSGVTSVLHSDEDGHEDQGGVVLRREQVKMVLFEGKQDVSLDTGIPVDDRHALLGSLSAVVGRDLTYDSYLPDWLEEGTESSLRDSEYDAPQVPIHAQPLPSAIPRSIASSSKNTPVILTPTGPSPSGSFVRQNGKSDWTDLDKFYAETESTEEEEGTEEEAVESDEEEADSNEDGDSEEEEEGSAEEPDTDSVDEGKGESEDVLHHAR